MATEPRAINSPNQEMNCRQGDGTYKRSFPTKEAAESFEVETRQRFKNEFQYAYECPLIPGHWHLSRNPCLPLEDRTSAPYSRALIPMAPETEERFRSTAANVRERRERVRDIVSLNPDKIYAELAEILEIENGTFISDVKYLIDRGLLPPRQNRTSSAQKTFVKAPATTKLAELDAQLQSLMAARAEIEAQVAREEADRIEREKVHISWVNVDSGLELSVRKGKLLVVAPLAAWHEIVAAVAAEIQDK